MARSEHLPIYKSAYDLCLWLEQVVRGFSRYHKYAIGSDLRESSRRILRLVVRANARADKAPGLSSSSAGRFCGTRPPFSACGESAWVAVGGLSERASRPCFPVRVSRRYEKLAVERGWSVAVVREGEWRGHRACRAREVVRVLVRPAGCGSISR